MEQIVVEAKPREERGKNAARRMRVAGFVPAVMYAQAVAYDYSKLYEKVFVDQQKHPLSLEWSNDLTFLLKKCYKILPRMMGNQIIEYYLKESEIYYHYDS